MNDRVRWNEKYRAEIHAARVNTNLVHYAHLLKRGRVLDLAGGLGQNGAWLALHSNEFRIVNADISEEGLSRAPKEIVRVVVEARHLPFTQQSFDTILNIRFYDPRVNFFELLALDGTVFFETYTIADQKYRPDFNPCYLFDLANLSEMFRGLEILQQQETDDGKRVYATVIARRIT